MRVQLIYNPAAGQRDATKDLRKVIAFLESQGWNVALRTTLGPGDAISYAREAAANGYDMAVAVGGDGTLGEVATGLAHSDCAMGVLPIGTGNVWAHMLGLPVWTLRRRSALMDAAHILVDGRPCRIDLGKVGDRYFLLWSGIGFDAQIAHDVEPHREVRRNLGNLAYYVTAIALSLRLRGTRVTVTIDGQTVRQRALLIVVSNAQLYGRSWRLAPQAQLDDGLLETYIFKGSNTLDALRHFVLLMQGKHIGDPRVETYRAKHIEIRAETPLPLHTDGDPAGSTPATITVVPKALDVIVPAWASGSLFQDGGFSDSASLMLEEQPSLAQRIAARLRYERERARSAQQHLRNAGGRVLGARERARSARERARGGRERRREKGERVRNDGGRRFRFPPWR